MELTKLLSISKLMDTYLFKALAKILTSLGCSISQQFTLFSPQGIMLKSTLKVIWLVLVVFMTKHIGICNLIEKCQVLPADTWQHQYSSKDWMDWAKMSAMWVYVYCATENKIRCIPNVFYVDVYHIRCQKVFFFFKTIDWFPENLRENAKEKK